MAHFAKINSDNVVIGSAMVDNVYMVDDQGVEHESYGLNRLNKLYGDISPFYWKQWSVNTYEGKYYTPHNPNELAADQSKSFRKNAGSTGSTYDAARDAFIPAKTHSSWVLDETTCVYMPPVALPTDAALIGITRSETLKWHAPGFSATYVAAWDDATERFIGKAGAPGETDLSTPTHTWNGTAWVLI